MSTRPSFYDIGMFDILNVGKMAKKEQKISSLTTQSEGPDFQFEQEAMAKFGGCVAGTDEAGRGPWAGPVVAGAVILNPNDIPPGLNDSKKTQ